MEAITVEEVLGAIEQLLGWGLGASTAFRAAGEQALSA